MSLPVHGANPVAAVSERRLRGAAVLRWAGHVATDADEHAQNLSLWEQRYDQISSGRFSGRIDELWLADSQVFVETANQRLRQVCSPRPNALWFGIPLPEQAAARLDGQPLAPDTIALGRGGEEFELHTPADFDLYGVVIDTAAWMEFVETIEHVDPQRLLRQLGVRRVDPRARHALCSALSGWLAAPQRPQAAGAMPASSGLQHALFGALCALLLPQDASAAAMPPSSRRRLVRRVSDFVLSRPDAPVSITEICAEFHVSRRSLQYCFLDVAGLPPLAYLRALRLNAVRRELRSGRALQVSDTAFAWGFEHLSQFSRDYARQFGQLPSQTLRKSH